MNPKNLKSPFSREKEREKEELPNYNAKLQLNGKN